jgi:phosphoribosylformimino-5-aminoimidazole carboxamide ribotide isomerase
MTDTMTLIPAIDLLDGRCVRLVHGDFRDVTHYDEAPEAIALRYLQGGAEWLHVVDLAASRDGDGADTSPLFKLLKSADQKVQTGGGVRNGGDIELRLEHGAERVVIGSLCAKEPARFLGWLERFGRDAIVAALDVRLDSDGVPRPRIFGWTEDAGMNLWDLMDELVDGGLQHALVTDIGRDGALAGPNVELYREIIQRYPGIALQASGGVSRIDDLRTLQGAGAAGAIVGKALLERAFTVAHALDALR